MIYLRSLISVLSAPLLYGLVCVPFLGLLYRQVPDLINEQGGTSSVPLLLGTEALQFLILVLCGYVSAALAPGRVLLHVAVTIALMLAIALFVQLGFWEAVPTWHHYVFFASVAIGIFIGAQIRIRHPGKSQPGS